MFIYLLLILVNIFQINFAFNLSFNPPSQTKILAPLLVLYVLSEKEVGFKTKNLDIYIYIKKSPETNFTTKTLQLKILGGNSMILEIQQNKRPAIVHETHKH